MGIDVIGRPINWFAKSGPAKKIVDYAAAHSTNAAKVLVAGNLLRDGINCAFYTYQSYTNEKIPKEKRGFVSALDLSNGVLNIASQFLLGNLILSDSLQEKISDKWFGKKSKELTQKMRETAENELKKHNINVFDFKEEKLADIEKQLKEKGLSKDPNLNYNKAKEDVEGIIKKYPKQYRDLKDVIVDKSFSIQEEKHKKLFGLISAKYKDPEFVLKKAEVIKDAVYKEVLGKSPLKYGQEYYANHAKGLKQFAAVFITTIFAKRMLVPFLATPSAGWIKDNYMNTDKDSSKAKTKDTKSAEQPATQNNTQNIFELYNKTQK